MFDLLQSYVGLSKEERIAYPCTHAPTFREGLGWSGQGGDRTDWPADTKCLGVVAASRIPADLTNHGGIQFRPSLTPKAPFASPGLGVIARPSKRMTGSPSAVMEELSFRRWADGQVDGNSMDASSHLFHPCNWRCPVEAGYFRTRSPHLFPCAEPTGPSSFFHSADFSGWVVKFLCPSAPTSCLPAFSLRGIECWSCGWDMRRQ